MPKLIEEKMSVYEFGRKLLTTEDLDPVYVVLQVAIEQELITPVQLQRWLIAYWCFYHCGTASWITDVRENDEGAFWKRMLIAASSKDYPRSPERRHFRADNAIVSVNYLTQRGVSDLWEEFTRASYEQRVLPLAEVLEIVQQWVGFGPWIAFKVADMLERLDLCKINFPIEGIYASPSDGATRMWYLYGLEAPNLSPPKWVVRWAVENLLGHFRLDNRLAPPRYERPINVQEVETILCKWHGYMKGKYHIGKDIHEVEKGLRRFYTCPLAKNLLTAGRAAKLWS